MSETGTEWEIQRQKGNQIERGSKKSQNGPDMKQKNLKFDIS